MLQDLGVTDSELKPSSIVWNLGPDAWGPLGQFLNEIGLDLYRSNRTAFQQFMCAYFASDGDCRTKLGKSISPLGGGSDGWKHLKARWLVPGGGKSGGFRVALRVHCESREVVLAGVWRRSTDPSKGEFEEALAAATPDDGG